MSAENPASVELSWAEAMEVRNWLWQLSGYFIAQEHSNQHHGPLLSGPLVNLAERLDARMGLVR